jgi:tetratricopeptide (TPR) repeat protein
MKNVEQPLDPVEYRFWLPPEGMTLTTGPDNQEVAVPQILLPIHAKELDESPTPSEKMIGEGLYDYLRRFPDCPQAEEYAKIIKAAYPFYFADIGSQIIMLEAKEVDPPYIQRKINMLKILALVEPDNFGLLQRIGIAYFELALIYSELINVRRELGYARQWLEKARQLQPEELGTLNYLAQICYYHGAYPQAKLYWKIIADKLEEGPARTELLSRVERVEAEELPEQPLIDKLEAIGFAMEHYNIGEYHEACVIMERLEEEGTLPSELPNPEFFYFLGLCREKTDELAAAFESYSKVLELDPEHQVAQEAIDRIQSPDQEMS